MPTEKQLSREIRLANHQRHFVPSQMFVDLANQLFDHRGPSTIVAVLWVDRKIQHMQAALMQFVNHEPNSLPVAIFTSHADHVGTARATLKVLASPRKFKAFSLNFQYRQQVSPN
jgi:hypothetical protein